MGPGTPAEGGQAFLARADGKKKLLNFFFLFCFFFSREVSVSSGRGNRAGGKTMLLAFSRSGRDRWIIVPPWSHNFFFEPQGSPDRFRSVVFTRWRKEWCRRQKFVASSARPNTGRTRHCGQRGLSRDQGRGSKVSIEGDCRGGGLRWVRLIKEPVLDDRGRLYGDIAAGTEFAILLTLM